ncbi:MAG: hypothetical protein DRN17_08430 [Thermoplasmata archaeon]|nr:MAG: hypothetical protein DRN17_08430 [Thermoplasmata archaeon]
MPVIVENGKAKAVSDLVDVNGTSGVALFTCMPPTVKFVIKKLYIYNQDTADHEVTVGEYDTTGASWKKDKFILKVPAGETKVLNELPSDFVMTVDPATAILAWAAKLDAAVSANPVKVKAEFEMM